MASTHEVQVKISSAKDLKNVNWRHGTVKPYAVAWVEPSNKCSTKVDEHGDTSPEWDETLTIPIPGPVNNDTTLYIDIVHAGTEPDTKQLVGSARLPLRDVVDDVGYDERSSRTLTIKRPSSRPQGKVDVKVTVREPRYRAPEPYYGPPYGVPPAGSGGYRAPPPPHAYGDPYAAPPPPPPVYGGMYASQASRYPYNAAAAAYGQPAQASYGQVQYGQEEKKKSKFGGMGTGLAVGAVAGALGAFALAEGVDYVEDKIADDVAEKVVEDLSYYGDDDFYGEANLLPTDSSPPPSSSPF